MATEARPDQRERPTDDNINRVLLTDELSNTEGNAGGNIKESTLIFGELLNVVHFISGVNGGGGSKLLPGSLLTIVSVKIAARLKGDRLWLEYTIHDNAAADASTEGEIDILTFKVMAFIEGAKVSIVFKVERTGELVRNKEILHARDNVKLIPGGEIRGRKRLAILDDTRVCDDGHFNCATRLFLWEDVQDGSL